MYQLNIYGPFTSSGFPLSAKPMIVLIHAKINIIFSSDKKTKKIIFRNMEIFLNIFISKLMKLTMIELNQTLHIDH